MEHQRTSKNNKISKVQDNGPNCAVVRNSNTVGCAVNTDTRPGHGVKVGVLHNKDTGATQVIVDVNGKELKYSDKGKR